MDAPCEAIRANAVSIHAWQHYRDGDRQWECAVIHDDMGDCRGIIYQHGHGELYSRAAGHVAPAAMAEHLNALAHHGAMIIPARLATRMRLTPLRLTTTGGDMDVLSIHDALFA